MTGVMIVDEWFRQSGRPITLQGGDNRSWVPKTTVLQLQTLADLPGKIITLTLSDNRVFSTIMDRSGGSPIEAKQIFNIFPTEPTDFYTLKVRLISRS
jgi:hypothetical protein